MTADLDRAAAKVRASYAAEMWDPDTEAYGLATTILALLDDLDRLEAERDEALGKVAAYRSALAYITRPTMGYPGHGSPEAFARDEASDQAARLALVTCIRIATSALGGSDGGEGGL